MTLQPSLRERLRYRFDLFLSRSSSSMFLSLLLLFLVTVVLGGGLFWAFHPFSDGPENNDVTAHTMNPIAAAYWAFLKVADPGNMGDEADGTFLQKTASIFSGMVGVVIFGLLIGFITTQLEAKIESLKRGRTNVLERGHTLILGWHEEIFEIIRMIVEANSNCRDRAIVVLADRDKVEMDEEIRERVPELKTTRIITRSGDVSSTAALGRVAVDEARSIVVLPHARGADPEDARLLSDARVIKTILAICGRPARKPAKYNIVTEVFDPENERIIRSISADEVSCLDGRELIARLLVQTSRQTGLSVVYNEILDFSGQEMYLIEFPETHGRTFGDALLHFPASVALGLERAAEGRVQINPPMDTSIAPGDRLLFVAEDDDTTVYSPMEPDCQPLPLPPMARAEHRPERHLLLGWNEKAPVLIREYAAYAAPGSEVMVVHPDPTPQMHAALEAAAGSPNLSVRLRAANYMAREQVEALEPFGYDNIVLLSQELHGTNMEKSDSETIYTLLLLRDIKSKVAPDSPTKYITEILDPANRELIEIAHVNDFIISNKLVGMIFAQISEQRQMRAVYADLFRAEGSEIYIKDAARYFPELPARVSFWQAVLQARQRGEAAFGYKLKRFENDPSKNFGIKINPDKQALIDLGPGDALIVVAEDET